jgi:hypothetical protein
VVGIFSIASALIGLAEVAGLDVPSVDFYAKEKRMLGKMLHEMITQLK